MDPRIPAQHGSPSKIVRIVWFVTIVVAGFTGENLWIDPWLWRKSHHRLTLVAEALSDWWLLVFGLMFILLLFLVVAQVLVLRDRGVARGKKWGTSGATICTILLCIFWVHSTTIDPYGNSLIVRRERHKVTINWSASSSTVDGYNVYRSLSPGGPYERINEERVGSLTFVDREVRSGARYFYVVRAVAKNAESLNSKEITVAVP